LGRERSSYPLVTLESGDFSVQRIRDESQNFRSPNAGWQRAMSMRNIYKCEFFVSNAPCHECNFCVYEGLKAIKLWRMFQIISVNRKNRVVSIIVPVILDIYLWIRDLS
jgi:hypothetical protein